MTQILLISLSNSKEDSSEKTARRQAIPIVSLAHSSLCGTALTSSHGLARHLHECKLCEWAIFGDCSCADFELLGKVIPRMVIAAYDGKNESSLSSIVKSMGLSGLVRGVSEFASFVSGENIGYHRLRHRL